MSSLGATSSGPDGLPLDTEEGQGGKKPVSNNLSRALLCPVTDNHFGVVVILPAVQTSDAMEVSSSSLRKKRRKRRTHSVICDHCNTLIHATPSATNNNASAVPHTTNDSKCERDSDSDPGVLCRDIQDLELSTRAVRVGVWRKEFTKRYCSAKFKWFHPNPDCLASVAALLSSVPTEVSSSMLAVAYPAPCNENDVANANQTIKITTDMIDRLRCASAHDMSANASETDKYAAAGQTAASCGSSELFPARTALRRRTASHGDADPPWLPGPLRARNPFSKFVSACRRVVSLHPCQSSAAAALSVDDLCSKAPSAPVNQSVLPSLEAPKCVESEIPAFVHGRGPPEAERVDTRSNLSGGESQASCPSASDPSVALPAATPCIGRHHRAHCFVSREEVTQFLGSLGLDPRSPALKRVGFIVGHFWDVRLSMKFLLFHQQRCKNNVTIK